MTQRCDRGPGVFLRSQAAACWRSRPRSPRDGARLNTEERAAIDAGAPVSEGAPWPATDATKIQMRRRGDGDDKQGPFCPSGAWTRRHQAEALSGLSVRNWKTG